MAKNKLNIRQRNGAGIDLATLKHKAALSIAEFCLLHSICRATFVNYERAGIGPKVMRVGGRVLVSREAAEAWRKHIEANPLPKRGRPSVSVLQHRAED